MSSKPKDSKSASLARNGTLNSKPASIKDELFGGEHTFFDPRDLVQVKYEMLRRVDSEGASVSKASEDFGFSRPSFYEAKRLFDANGIAGLIPKPRGPKSPHKLTDEILDFIASSIKSEASHASEIANLVKKKFNVEIHPRSISRAVAARSKKKIRRRKE
jgi:transposase